jgi:hypothetical protein
LIIGLLLAVALAAEVPDSRDLMLGEGVIGLALLCLCTVFRWSPCIAWATGLLGLEYVTGLLIAHAGIDSRAALAGAALYLMSELANWSIELRSSIQDDLAVYRWRALVVVGVAVGGGMLSIVPLVAAELPFSSNPLLTLIGTTAAVAVLAILVAAVWRIDSVNAEVTPRERRSAVTKRPSDRLWR